MGKPIAGEVVVFPFPQTNLQSGKDAKLQEVKSKIRQLFA